MTFKDLLRLSSITLGQIVYDCLCCHLVSANTSDNQQPTLMS